jgi:hypothetical protein
MKNLIVFVMTAVALTIFNGCQKDELGVSQQADDVQPQEVVQPDVYVENGYLVFKSQEVFDSTLAIVQNMSDEDFINWENEFGFISANTYYLNAENEFANIQNEEQKNKFIQNYSKYLNIQDNGIDTKFYAKSLGDLLNIEGIVKIGNSVYFFTEEKEYVILDGDLNLLEKLKTNKDIKKSARKNLVVFDPFKNNELKSATDHEFLVGDEIYTDWNRKRLNYTLERTIFTYVHSFDPYTGTTYYSCGYKLFLRLKQYYLDGGIWKSDKISYWVKDQSLHWNGLIDGQVVETYNGTFPDKSFGSTRNSVYVYYADRSFITTNPNVSDMFIYDYTSTFRSNRLHDNGCGSCIFWKTITYED